MVKKALLKFIINHIIQGHVTCKRQKVNYVVEFAKRYCMAQNLTNLTKFLAIILSIFSYQISTMLPVMFFHCMGIVLQKICHTFTSKIFLTLYYLIKILHHAVGSSKTNG